MQNRRRPAVPDQTQPRIRAIVMRSAPSIDRPRLPEEIERSLDPLERRTASCYADAENRTANLRKLARSIRSNRK